MEGRVKIVIWVMTIAVVSFFAWLHAVNMRLRKNDSAYNKYVFGAAVLLYGTCNFIQAQTFAYKTIFSLFFIVYSLIAIPFHIWLIVTWTKAKRNQTH